MKNIEEAGVYLRVLEQKKRLQIHGTEVQPKVPLEELEEAICYWKSVILTLANLKQDTNQPTNP